MEDGKGGGEAEEEDEEKEEDDEEERKDDESRRRGKRFESRPARVEDEKFEKRAKVVQWAERVS